MVNLESLFSARCCVNFAYMLSLTSTTILQGGLYDFFHLSDEENGAQKF